MQSRINFRTALLFTTLFGFIVSVSPSFTFAIPQEQQESTEGQASEGSEDQKKNSDSKATEREAESENSENKNRSKKKDDPEDTPVQGVSFSNPVETKWQIGAVVVGGAGPGGAMILTIPIPNDWPEQTVTVMEEKIPSSIGKASFRDLKSGVRQLVVEIPKIKRNQQIPIAITILVSTQQVDGPPDPTLFVRAKSSNREGRLYLGNSPHINARDSKIRKLLKEVTKDKSNPWEEVKAIYDWIGDNITEIEEPAKDTGTVLKTKEGGIESKTGLFVAMCRAHKIPARMVWVEGTQHAEFMLADAQRNAHWFPCSVAGFREFGAVSEPRVILQKGDSIKVPEKKKPQKFVAEFAVSQGANIVKPKVHFFRRVLADE